MFNFLKKETVLHCYTHLPAVYNYAPIRRASKFLPEWWKKLPQTATHLDDRGALNTEVTMRGCTGFTGLYSKGFILPLWSDLKLLIGRQQDPNQPGTDYFRYQFADKESKINFHTQAQHTGIYPRAEYQHLKIISPWLLRYEEDIEVAAIQPTWNFNNPENMFVPPGSLNFKYQCSTNVNTFWKRQLEDTTYLLPHGQPLLHLIPLTEKKIRLQLHLVSKEEFIRVRSIGHPITFTNKYKTHSDIIKKNNCPYNHDIEK